MAEQPTPEPTFGDLQLAVQAAFKPDFHAVEVRVARRRRRGRAQLTVVAAGLTVALIVGAVALAGASTGAHGPVPPANSLTPSTLPSPPPAAPAPNFDHLQPAADVWAGAVRRLPDTLPGGTQYVIAVALGHDRYVVQAIAKRGTNGGIRSLGTIFLFDVPANRATRLSPIASDGASYTNVDVDGDWLVWQASPKTATTTQIWAARLSGGGPSLVADKVDTNDSWHIAVLDGAAVWTSLVDGTPTLYRVALTGGAATPVPGGAGWYMTASGWAVQSTGKREPTDIPVMWNVATGERRPFVLNPQAKHMTSCAAQWCVGMSLDGGLAAQRRDGTAYVRAGNIGILDCDGPDGRFAIGHIELTTVPAAERSTAYPGWRGVLWDLGTGRAGTVGGQFDNDGFWSPRATSGVVPLDLDSWQGRAHHILDLTVITG